MNVLVVNCHPRKKSFSESITAAYVAGVEEAGVNVQVLSLADLSFDINVTHYSPKQQCLEPDIAYAQQLIKNVDHITFIYPTWWGTMPALLKGFIDRVFTEGFSFREIEGGTGYSPLLSGKTAKIITTMDTPYLVYQLLYRAPGHNAMRRSVLEFCGFEMDRIISFGPIRGSNPVQREKWLKKAKMEGFKLRRGALSPAKRLSVKVLIWLKAIRLQFYPMTAVAYAAGAWAGVQSGNPFQSYLFYFGYAWLFFLEVATVLINEKADYNSDEKNEYFSPFTGGSRVIVDKLLSVKEIKKGIAVTLGLSFIMLGLVFSHISANYNEIIMSCAALTILAISYTAAPLRLSYHTLGEVTVGITHSFAVILCGYLFMGGQMQDIQPWALGFPLFLSVLPSIILAGVPDYDADKLANKKTIAVRFGKKTAFRLALFFVCLSSFTLISFSFFDIYPLAFNGILYFVIPHAILVSVLLKGYISNPSGAKRIDSLMIVTLLYLVWFGLIPLINLT